MYIIASDERVVPGLSICLYCKTNVQVYNETIDAVLFTPECITELVSLNSWAKQCPKCKRIYILRDLDEV